MYGNAKSRTAELRGDGRLLGFFQLCDVPDIMRTTCFSMATSPSRSSTLERGCKRLKQGLLPLCKELELLHDRVFQNYLHIMYCADARIAALFLNPTGQLIHTGLGRKLFHLLLLLLQGFQGQVQFLLY